MPVGERVGLGLTGLLSLVLTGTALADVYVDWQLEENPLWLTALENAVPVVLGIGVFLAGYVVYTRQNDLDIGTVAKWQYVGAGGVCLIAAEGVGLQVIQGRLKPFLLVVQMTIGGAVAGTLVGVTFARQARIRGEMMRERNRFEALFENAPAEAVNAVLRDGELVIEEVNETFVERFADGDDPVGRSVFDLIAHGEGSRGDIREAIRSGTPIETRLETPTDVERRFYQLRVVPYEQGERAYLLYTDIMDLRETKRNLEATVDRLDRSNDRLQQFAYVASHDLQEPMRMVSSYVSLLETEYGDEFDDEAREYMDFAVGGAERMQEMIDGLLAYSRVRTQAEAFTDVDAGEVLDDTLKDLEMLIEERDVSITRDELPSVEADRSQLRQVFQNLVENAVEHGGERIHVGSKRRDGRVVFSVSDDGPGIPADRQDRIFEIFEQGSRDSQGTGIGLAICDRIVSRHGGDIRVDSGAGEGTTFSFTMPAA